MYGQKDMYYNENEMKERSIANLIEIYKLGVGGSELREKIETILAAYAIESTRRAFADKSLFPHKSEQDASGLASQLNR